MLGVVLTFAGSGASGVVNGVGTTAAISSPTGLAADLSGVLYVITDSTYIRKISSAGLSLRLVSYLCHPVSNRIHGVNMLGLVTTLAGGATGYADGTTSNALFSTLSGVAVDSNFNIYVTDATRIRKISSSGFFRGVIVYSTAAYFLSSTLC